MIGVVYQHIFLIVQPWIRNNDSEPVPKEIVSSLQCAY